MKKKILILQGIIPSYREPIYNLLSKKYDLTVGYLLNTQVKSDFFTQKKIPYFKFFNLSLPTLNFFKELNKYEIIILTPDMHHINYCILPFIPLKPKIISWSIGMRASYKVIYDTNRGKTFLDFVYLFILRNCNANIFYYEGPFNFWKNLINKKKVFIAFNTVNVLQSEISNEKKKDILFLGSLINGKGVLDLIKIYISIVKSDKKFTPNLIIVGEGYLENSIKILINKHNLSDRIIMFGGVYKELELSRIFKSIICCISPNQAGLSVLKCFGYGIPFITNVNAITGGEKDNIIHKVNGLLFSSFNELEEILRQTQNNKSFFHELGANAKKYYNKNASIKKMGVGFENAINYTLKK
jgi:glycosyltransferase involved in cell wall biosynthesis